MSRTIRDLSGASWRFGAVGRQPFALSLRDDRSAVTSWLPATVPGDTRADLIAAGRLPASTDPEALRGSDWVDEQDWWYTLPLEPVDAELTAVLEADGIDYLSSVWIDGNCLAAHEGMFARQSVVLSPYVNGLEASELAVRIWGSGALRKSANSLMRRGVRWALARLGVGAEYFPDRLNVTKAQFGFGWDFAPRVLTCGIWDAIRLVLVPGAYIEDVSAVAEPLDARADPVAVRWRVALTIRRFDCGQNLRAEIELSELDGEVIARSSPLPLTDTATQALVFDVPRLRRWWPWDQGNPHRYRLTLRLSDESGLCDEKEVVAGVRTVAREQLSTGHSWRFTVNGRHVFLRGANWVPADILPGTVKAEDYAQLVGTAVDAGVNYLRVWGGGLREKAAFYEECDRRGVLVSQEFPLACAFLDHTPRDRDYLALLEREATGMARGLRNHPSLLAWCGGNEINPRREGAALRTIERALQREDPTRPWVLASPSDGDVHNWDVWHGFAPWQELADATPPFMSEFGLQALPNMETLAAMFPTGFPHSLDEPRWAERKLQVEKLRHYLGQVNEDDLPALVEASQRAQATALQAGIEGCRLRREGSGHARSCGGVAVWQFNEPWRAVSWSVVDRDGRPKRAYEMLKASYAPLMVAARFARQDYGSGDLFEAEVWLVNDTPEARQVDALLVELELESAAQPVRLALRGKFEMGAAGAVQIDLIAFELDARPRSLRLVCEADGKAVATNAYDLTVYLPPRQPLRARLLRWITDRLLQGG